MMIMLQRVGLSGSINDELKIIMQIRTAAKRLQRPDRLTSARKSTTAGSKTSRISVPTSS
jgi:hypothetical protein